MATIRLGGPVFAGTRDPEALVALHRRAGCAAAYAPYIPDRVERDEFKRAFHEADIVLAEFGAYCLNISDPDGAQRERNIAEICRRLRRADEMGALCCVMHGGSYNNTGCVRAHREHFSDRHLEENVRTIQRILDEVRPRSTKLVRETESYIPPDSPELYLRLLRWVDRPMFAAHLDPVNLTLSPRRFYYSGDFLRRCFACLGPHLISTHAKDTNLVEPATAQLTETDVGNGGLDDDTYLTERDGLSQEPPLMIEHLSRDELPGGPGLPLPKGRRPGADVSRQPGARCGRRVRRAGGVRGGRTAVPGVVACSSACS